MNQPDPSSPSIAWRQGVVHPDREPLEVDVQDGRAEYVFSGPHRMTEGAKIEIIGGKARYSSGRFRA